MPQEAGRGWGRQTKERVCYAKAGKQVKKGRAQARTPVPAGTIQDTLQLQGLTWSSTIGRENSLLRAPRKPQTVHVFLDSR